MQRHLSVGATVIAALLAANRIPAPAKTREAPTTPEVDVMTLLAGLGRPVRVRQPARAASRPPASA